METLKLMTGRSFLLKRRMRICSMSFGRLPRIWSILSRICIEARSMFVPALNWRLIDAFEAEDVELRVSKLLTVARMSSIGRVMTRWASSGEDDGEGTWT